METTQTRIKVMKFENEILDLINHSEDFTYSDLQGIVQALVLKIMDRAL